MAATAEGGRRSRVPRHDPDELLVVENEQRDAVHRFEERRGLLLEQRGHSEGVARLEPALTWPPPVART